jgi:exonuclease VII small subunit
MAANIRDLLTNTKDIFMTDSAVGTLLDFERVLDELDLYAFANWKNGELVEGPVYEKYFVKCTFMWPFKKMPDPKGAVRLSEYDCEVSYKEDFFEHPGKVKSPNDFKPGTKVPKLVQSKIWLVEIVMPRKLMQDIEQGALELESGTIDLEDVDQAYETGADDETQDQQDVINQDQSQEPTQGQPNA